MNSVLEIFGGQQAVTVIVGLLGSGMGIRALITWMGRQGTINQGDTSQKDLIANLTEEAKRLRKLHEDEQHAHEDAKKALAIAEATLSEIRMQNKMLRRLLINSGMTTEELDTLLEIER